MGSVWSLVEPARAMAHLGVFGVWCDSLWPLAWPWRSLRKSWEDLGFRLLVDILDESLGAVGCDLRWIHGPTERLQDV